MALFAPGISNLFKTFKTNATVIREQYIDVKPTNTFDSKTEVFDFHIPRNSESYWSLRDSYLVIKVKLVKKNGDISLLDKIGVINSLGSSLFRTLEVTLNQHQFGSSPNLYHIRSYLENLLFYGKDAKGSYLKGELWYEDTPGQFHETDANGGLNQGLKDRSGFFRQSRFFTLEARIHHDLFLMPKWLLSGTEIDLRFYKSADTFTCMAENAADKPTIEIVDIKLKMCQKFLPQDVINSVEKQLETKPAIYDMQGTNMQKFIIESGRSNKELDNLFPSGRVPELLVIALIKSTNLDGDYGRSPFQLEHANIKSVGLYVDSVQVKKQPTKFLFDQANDYKNDAMEGYVNMFQSLKQFGTNFSNGISYYEYLNDYTTFVFNLSPEPGVLGNAEPRRGVVKIDFQFNTELSENYYAVVLSTEPTSMFIDKTRQLRMSDE